MFSIDRIEISEHLAEQNVTKFQLKVKKNPFSDAFFTFEVYNHVSIISSHQPITWPQQHPCHEAFNPLTIVIQWTLELWSVVLMFHITELLIWEHWWDYTKVTAWRYDTVPRENLSVQAVNSSSSDLLLVNWVHPELLKSDPFPKPQPPTVAVPAGFIWFPGSCPPAPTGSLWRPASHTWAERLPGSCALWRETSAGLWLAHKTPGDDKRKVVRRFYTGFFFVVIQLS